MVGYPYKLVPYLVFHRNAQDPNFINLEWLHIVVPKRAELEGLQRGDPGKLFGENADTVVDVSLA